jgi:hypothetical protein
MAKRGLRAVKSRTVPTVPQPTVLYPVVDSPADDPELSDADMERLENAGGVKLTQQVRTELRNIAAGWIAHDRLLQSRRPKEFRTRLQTMTKALERMIDSVDLNRTDAPALDRHLFFGCLMPNSTLQEKCWRRLPRLWPRRAN